MHGRHDHALDVIAELLATPVPDREKRLGKLSKPMLVCLLAIVLQDCGREKKALKKEVDRLNRRPNARETAGSVE